jgi:hypothetical protein
VEIVFLFAGLPFVAVGILIVTSELRAQRGSYPRRGTVIGFSKGQRDGYFHTVAQYVGPDGATRYVESAVGSSAPLGSMGDSINVLVKNADPERAEIQSSLSYVMGAVVGAMGLACCVVFFATFRATNFSIAGAGAVTALVGYKILGSLRQKRISLQEWRDTKKALRPRVFTEATKNQIRWADAAAVDASILKQQKANRFAIPILLVAGVGLLVLGGYLQRSTSAFLARALHAEGQVVDLVDSHSGSGDGHTYSAIVEFQVDGRTYKFTDSVGSNPPLQRRGDSVLVLYDPDQPRHARIDRGKWNLLLPTIVSAFGALLCSLGVWSAARRKPIHA